jgi:hypothetical protein
MYPLHLMVEAKCYASHRPVGVEVPRNSVGVLKDISENYFTYTRRGNAFRGPRYNYSAAVFSASGYTHGAVEYAVAHQVFLIQYENVPVIQPLIDSIRGLDEACINLRGQQAITAARTYYRRCLSVNQVTEIGDPPPEITELGQELLRGPIAEACRAIGGSYFGMLQGQWPLHLLRSVPLPPEAFATDVVSCRVHGNQMGEWMFVPIQAEPGEPGWFELEFCLPPFIAELLQDNWRDPVAVADLKRQHFSFIDLTGVIGDIRRSVRLQLDSDWIEAYIRRQRE